MKYILCAVVIDCAPVFECTTVFDCAIVFGECGGARRIDPAVPAARLFPQAKSDCAMQGGCENGQAI